MKATIKLIDPNTVIRVKPMCYSPQDRIEFTKQINELLNMKLIVQSKSPHMSPAFLVENEAEKRRGKKRMVVNYKKINEATIGDSHNLPNMQELLTLLRGKSIFSSFDCKSGFWQVLLDEQSQLLTAFTCPNGHFQWKVVPFGLKQAPMTPLDTSKKQYMTIYGQAVSLLEYSGVDCSLINTKENSSTSGWVFLLGGGAISWASKKRTCITGSTMEYEFVTLATAGKEAIYAATLTKAYSQMYNGKSRHLGVRHNMIRELIMNEVISIEFVRSQQNLADHLTKGLARDLVIKSAEGMRLKSN
ncbi:zinc finger, CCHC-type containing protein [Tanacetum coccineum]